MFYNTKYTNSNIARAGKCTQFTGGQERNALIQQLVVVLFFFSVQGLLIIFDTSLVVLLASPTAEGQERVLYMCHLWTHVNEDLDPWPYECFLFYGDVLCLILLVHVIKNSQVSNK